MLQPKDWLLGFKVSKRRQSSWMGQSLKVCSMASLEGNLYKLFVTPLSILSRKERVFSYQRRWQTWPRCLRALVRDLSTAHNYKAISMNEGLTFGFTLIMGTSKPDPSFLASDHKVRVLRTDGRDQLLHSGTKCLESSSNKAWGPRAFSATIV